MSTATQLTIDELNWEAIRANIHKQLNGELRRATWAEMADAIDSVHSSEEQPLTPVESAVSAGILRERDDGYAFNRRAINGLQSDERGDSLSTDEIREEYGIVIPETLASRQYWFVRRTGDKTLRAPWSVDGYWAGTLRRCLWNEDITSRPETTLEEVLHWTSLDENLLKGYDWSDGELEDGEPLSLKPAILLPHEERAPDDSSDRIVLIDLDDVRDPDTGDVLPAAKRILNEANTFAERSQSGKGFHLFVYGKLPAGVRTIVESLTDEPFVKEDGDENDEKKPKVEIYDHARVCAITGDHVDGTPKSISEGQDLIDDLIEEYYDDDRRAEDVLDNLSNDTNDFDRDSTNHSPYYDVDPTSIVSTGSFRKVGKRIQGPHPGHGSSGGADYQSGGRNFAIEGDVWTCYRHGTGGNALHLVAVLEGHIDCSEAGSSCLDSLTDAEFTQLCLDARDNHGFNGKPPYRALLGIAKEKSLAAESADQFDRGLRDILTEMYEKANSSSL